MTREEIKEKLQLIFQDIFQDEKLEIKETNNADDIEAWDSLTHMQLISEVEHQFQISFLLDEVLQLQNVGDLIQQIQTKLTSTP
ncbi:MAG TPA: acyl carrier protein [Chitinophagaceae bacterium]|nr:acyl carrier protein [Chitinophagaceae bacterium]